MPDITQSILWQLITNTDPISSDIKLFFTMHWMEKFLHHFLHLAEGDTQG